MDFPAAFALLDGTKRPAVRWSDPATRAPSSRFAPGRYGLPTGAANGVWVLDLDVKGDVKGTKSIQATGQKVPDTYTVRTPGGGYHLYFRWDAARPVGNRISVLPGVDVRGEGGYVCAGGDYEIAFADDVAEAPEWLYDLVGREEAVPTPAGGAVTPIDSSHPEWSRRLALARAYIEGEPPCIEGEGKSEAQTFKMALRLSRTYELPVETSMSILTPYFDRCRPLGYVAEKMRRALVRAAEVGQGAPGTFAGSFLAGVGGAQEVPVPANDATSDEWRRRRNPAHVYDTDLSSQCAGAALATVRVGTKELTGTFTGPAAPPTWRGVWQYDAFRRKLIAVNPPFQLDAETTGLSKRDLASVQVWMACNGGVTSVDAIANALDVAGRHAEFHPVREYLAALPVVTVEAARAYFSGIAGRLWGATDRDALESEHVKRFAIAAVRRIRRPGTKVDTMLVLAGEQGFRKSMFCAHLFGEFFLDQMPPIASGRGHEASIAIEGRWGVEFAEMNALIHAPESAKKEFLTRCEDKYRPVFGVAVQERPRECVFIGTTNDDEILSDPTGDTRYDLCDVKRPIDLSFDRDEFWACAAALEAAGELHYRDRAVVARDGTENAAFTAEDVWTDTIVTYARGVAADSDGERYVTARMCVMYGLVIPTDRQDQRILNRVKGILRRSFGPSKVRWTDGRPLRVYRVR